MCRMFGIPLFVMFDTHQVYQNQMGKSRVPSGKFKCFSLQRTRRGLKTDENFMSLLFSEGVKTEFYPALVSIPKRAKTGMA